MSFIFGHIRLFDARINFLSGFSFLSLKSMPISVPMIMVFAFVSFANLYIPDVEHTWSARSITSGLHSGWQAKTASGCFSLSFKTSSGLSLSPVRQLPLHHSLFFFAVLSTYIE